MTGGQTLLGGAIFLLIAAVPVARTDGAAAIECFECNSTAGGDGGKCMQAQVGTSAKKVCAVNEVCFTTKELQAANGPVKKVTRGCVAKNTNSTNTDVLSTTICITAECNKDAVGGENASHAKGPAGAPAKLKCYACDWKKGAAGEQASTRKTRQGGQQSEVRECNEDQAGGGIECKDEETCYTTVTVKGGVPTAVSRGCAGVTVKEESLEEGKDGNITKTCVTGNCNKYAAEDIISGKVFRCYSCKWQTGDDANHETCKNVEVTADGGATPPVAHGNGSGAGEPAPTPAGAPKQSSHRRQEAAPATLLTIDCGDNGTLCYITKEVKDGNVTLLERGCDAQDKLKNSIKDSDDVYTNTRTCAADLCNSLPEANMSAPGGDKIGSGGVGIWKAEAGTGGGPDRGSGESGNGAPPASPAAAIAIFALAGVLALALH